MLNDESVVNPMSSNISICRNTFLSAIICAWFLLFPSTAVAQDYSGWWWNESESGRGINIGHNNDLVFGALFLYDESGNPLWATFTGILNNNAATGPLNTFTGPPMNSSYDSSQVAPTNIGTATITFTGNNTATISYNAGSFSGPTQITRFPVGPLPIDGRFKASGETVTHCDPSEIGYTSNSLVTMQISGNNLNIIIQEELPEESSLCIFNGTYTQQGNRLSAEGTGTCTLKDLGGTVTEEFAGTWATDNLAVDNEWLRGTFDISFDLGILGSCGVTIRVGGYRSNLAWPNL